jgi:prepilin-type N-terminal cleavage/methylation domain
MKTHRHYRAPASACPHRSRARSFGFTLIELLTVIAIVGILAAIIIPVVSTVRKNAQRATCVSNIRDVGAAVFAYALDNRDKLPGPVMHSFPNTYQLAGSDYDLKTNPTLANHLAKYLKLPPPTSGEARYAPQFLCPAWHAAVGGKEASVQVSLNRVWRGHVALGKRAGGGNPPDSNPMTLSRALSTPSPGVTDVLARTGDPSRMVIVTEMDKSNYSSAPDNYHGNHTRTRLFFDGRVELVKYTPKP